MNRVQTKLVATIKLFEAETEKESRNANTSKTVLYSNNLTQNTSVENIK